MRMKMNCLSFSSKNVDDSSKSTSTCSTSATSSQTYDSLDGDEEYTTRCSSKVLSKYDDVVSINERTSSSSLWKNPIEMKEEEEDKNKENTRCNVVRKSKSYSSFENLCRSTTADGSNDDDKKKKKIRKSQSHTSFDLENHRLAVTSSDNGEDQRKEREYIRTSILSSHTSTSSFDQYSVDYEQRKKIKKKEKKKKRKKKEKVRTSFLLVKEQQSSSSDDGNDGVDEKKKKNNNDHQEVCECKSKSPTSLEHLIADGACADADDKVDADADDCADITRNRKKKKKKSNSIKSSKFEEEEWASSVSHSPARTAKKPLYHRSSSDNEYEHGRGRFVVVPPSLQLGLLHTQNRGLYHISSEKAITTAAGVGENSCIVDKKKKGTESDFMHQPYQHEQQHQQLVMMAEDPPQPPEVPPTTTTMTLTANEVLFDAHDDDHDDDHNYENENRDLELLLLLSERVQTTFEQAPSRNFEYEATIESCFPGGAISNETVVTDVVSVLYEKCGYTLHNTHLITSFVCCDNDGAGSTSCQLEDDLTSIYQQKPVKLGGLANLFASTTTIGLFNDMVTAEQIQDENENNDDGYYCLLVFGPHVSLAADGTISKVERNFIDFQPTAVQELISSYAQRLAAADAAGENRMIELPYALYDSQDRVLSEMVMTTQIQQQAQQQALAGSTSTSTSTSATGTKHCCCRGLAIVGGIQISTEGPNIPDYFHPLRFDYMNYGIDGDEIVVEDLLDSLTSTTTVRMKTE